MRILVSGIPGAGKTTVINDILESLCNEKDWQDIIRYSDTLASSEDKEGFAILESSETLRDEFKALTNNKVPYHRDLVYCGMTTGIDWIAEYPFGDCPAPEHTAFFDVVLNVSQFNYDKKFITVTKNRYGKAGQLLSFEFVKNDDGEMSIKITERKYVE